MRMYGPGALFGLVINDPCMTIELGPDEHHLYAFHAIDTAAFLMELVLRGVQSDSNCHKKVVIAGTCSSNSRFFHQKMRLAAFGADILCLFEI